MFKGRKRFLEFTPKDGIKVVIKGSVEVYEKNGYYQLKANSMVVDGVGPYHIAFEKLKKKLEKEGLFDQKHKKEMEASEKVAAFYGVKRVTLDLGEIFRGSRCSLLEGSAEEIPHEEYAEQLAKTGGAPVNTYVPFRNGLFLSAAASVGLSNGCEAVYYGAHADDAAGNAYPDTSVAFNRLISEAVYEGSGGAIQIVAPFINASKAHVVAVGAEIGVPFALTWSCYEGHEKACGTCGTCRDRKRAFEENGLVDPVEYETAEEKR